MRELHADSADELIADVERLGGILDHTIDAREGDGALALVGELRGMALQLRAGTLPGGRAALADRIGALDLAALDLTARSTTNFFHLINCAEEQHRMRVLRRRDHVGAPPDGSIAALCADLGRAQVPADEMRTL